MTNRVKRFARGPVLGLAALCLAFAGASSSLTTNALIGSDGQLTACVKTKTGKLRLVTADRPCRKNEERIAWSQQGPAGPAGSIEGAPAGGDLAGSYPEPTIAPAEPPVPVADNPNVATDPCAAPTPPTLVLCGTNAQRWRNGGFGLPGLDIWRDRLGHVHIRGSVRLSTGTLGNLNLFVLPAELRPKRIQGFPIVTGDGPGASGSALLVVNPDESSGFVSLFSPSDPTDSELHLGEITYRTDA